MAIATGACDGNGSEVTRITPQRMITENVVSDFDLHGLLITIVEVKQTLQPPPGIGRR